MVFDGATWVWNPGKFRQHYTQLVCGGQVTLEQDDVIRICTRVVDNEMETGLVAEQFAISHRRIQLLAKEYR